MIFFFYEIICSQVKHSTFLASPLSFNFMPVVSLCYFFFPMLHTGCHNPQELSLQYFLQQYILETKMQLSLLKMKQSQIQLSSSTLALQS